MHFLASDAKWFSCRTRSSLIINHNKSFIISRLTVISLIVNVLACVLYIEIMYAFIGGCKMNTREQA